MKYIRYWEDLSRERLIFAEQDAHSYELVQKLFGYTKESSFYLYHKGALGGYFSERDLEVERRVGYAFYSVPENAERVITLKREKRAALDAFVSSVEHADISTLSDVALRDLTLESIRHYYEMLNAHVLTQPQFFELLEAEGKAGEEEMLKKLASTRFEYTRKGFMLVMESARRLLREFARRNGLCLEEVESMTNEEFRLGRINGADLRGRMETFVLLLERGAQTILTGRDADVYVREYKTIAPVDSVRGVVGNKGYAKGRAFVIKNEEFDYDNLPKGMEKGMILIVQNAWPELDALCRLAAVIVTNEGGITSHGVVVAREFGIPCIVRTHIGTEIFKTGEMVEVDAEKGIVRKL